MTTSTNPNPKRRKRNERREDPRRMRETEKVREVVRLVYDYRILSQKQIQQLLGLSASTVQERLENMYDHHYLERVFLPVSEFGSSPTLYILDRRGKETMQRMGVEDFTGVPSKKISYYFKEHTMAINQFRIAIQFACQRLNWHIAVWKTENEIKADFDRVRVRTQTGKAGKIPVVPDSYFVIDIPDKGQSPYFLELDRGKMTLDRIKQKIMGYVAYHKSGGFEERYGFPGFRVLFVVDDVGKGRVRNMVEEAAGIEGIGRKFWFTHLRDVTPESVFYAPIWWVADRDQPRGEPVSLYRA